MTKTSDAAGDMAKVRVSFVSDVPATGFEWVRSQESQERGGEQFLIERRGRYVPANRVRPLESNPALFRAFAALSPGDAEGILDFANRHGWLGTDRADVEHRVAGGFVIKSQGELLDDWSAAVGHMARAVDLWDLITERNGEAIGRFISPPSDAPAVEPGRFAWWQYDSHPELAEDATPPPGGRERFQVGRVGDIVHMSDETVLFIAMQVLKFWFQQQLDPKLTPAVSAKGRYPVTIGLQNIAGGGPLELFVTPSSLLAAMWLQFARAVAENKVYRTCKKCGAWFEVEADARKGRRVFCSEACKSADYRQRRDLAVAMRSGGKKPAQIAQELDTDIETVKKWLGKAKGQPGS